MDPFELLKTDHKKVAQLFDELEAAAGTAKLGIFDQISRMSSSCTLTLRKRFSILPSRTQKKHTT